MMKTFYTTLKNNEQNRRIRKNKTNKSAYSHSRKQNNLNSEDLCFAFNTDNKLKSINKIKKYSDLKRIPNGKT